MDKSTRDKILDLLQHSPNLSAAEMSRALRVTRADIRYHLTSLVSQGTLVQMPAMQRSGHISRGRPAASYQLAPIARPDMIAALASTLLEMEQAPLPSKTFLDELARRLIPPNSSSASQPNVIERLNAALLCINQNPYHARWEAHRDGPQVIFNNCPFSAIIDRHPELCQVDRRIIEKLTGLNALQVRKIDLKGPTSTSCIFTLAKQDHSSK